MNTIEVFTRQLERLVVPELKTFFQKIYNSALADAQKLGLDVKSSDLVNFQGLLRKIPEYNDVEKEDLLTKVSEHIEPKETLRLVIEVLVNKTSSALLHGLPDIESHGEVDIQVPSTSAFLHRMSCRTAVKLFAYPSLMRRFSTDTEKARDEKERILVGYITEALHETLDEVSRKVITSYMSQSCKAATSSDPQVEQLAQTLQQQQEAAPPVLSAALPAPGPSPSVAKAAPRSVPPTPQMSPRRQGEPRLGDLQQEF